MGVTADANGHNALVRAAASYLRNTRGCPLVVTEPMNWWLRESPDAFGLWFPTSEWKSRWGWAPPKGHYRSFVVEVKTTVSDFHADKQKRHRKDGGGAGVYRYYLSPKGVLDEVELPDGWGLLRPWGKGARCIREATERQLTLEQARDEIALLYGALRGRYERKADADR